ncbi:MAG: hypothetical protein HRT66_12370 [Flavobacteriaceae bacterium]|nr:hypothetical protein [Flavobacteriaceae bacterium]
MKAFCILIIVFVLSSCTEIIEVETSSEKERLVIESSFVLGKPITRIYLSVSYPYFEALNDGINPSDVSEVSVTTSKGNTCRYHLIQGDYNYMGKYTYQSDELLLKLDETYTLKIVYKNEIYIGKETLLETPEVNRGNFNYNQGIYSDTTYFTFFFDDLYVEDNFYIIQDYSDRIYYFVDDNNKSDDEVWVRITEFDYSNVVLLNTSEHYQKYMSVLVSQRDVQYDPYANATSIAKGNCYNKTNPDNYPLGYFSVLDEKVIHLPDYIVPN